MKYSSRQAGGIAVQMQPQAAVWESCHRNVSKGDVLMEEAFEDGNGARMVAFRSVPHRIVFVNSALPEACQADLSVIGASVEDVEDIHEAVLQSAPGNSSSVVVSCLQKCMNQVVSLHIKHLSGQGEHALVSILVTPHSDIEAPGSGPGLEKMLRDYAKHAPSVTTSAGSVSYGSSSEPEDGEVSGSLWQTCCALSISDQANSHCSSSSPASFPRSPVALAQEGDYSTAGGQECRNNSDRGAETPRGDSMWDAEGDQVWHEFVAYRDVEIDMPASVHDRLQETNDAMAGLRDVGLLEAWEFDHQRSRIRLRADLETIESHVLDCKKCQACLMYELTEDWGRFWRVCSCLHGHLVGNDTPPQSPSTQKQVPGSACCERSEHTMVFEAASDLDFLMS